MSIDIASWGWDEYWESTLRGMAGGSRRGREAAWCPAG